MNANPPYLSAAGDPGDPLNAVDPTKGHKFPVH
jgi:hypothetical protein